MEKLKEKEKGNTIVIYNGGKIFRAKKCEIKWGADRKVIADWKEDDVV